jgi:4-aminobutyrate aminotransferase-like enzyme
MIDKNLQALLERRDRLLGPMSTFYEEPLHLVRGEGVRVWDAQGREYLDCYNNVPHVGHCHPKVVDAICTQAATLNTHTRYLHDTILDYVERLTATFDESLSSAIMTCTGSEANDIALRIARSVTGKTGVIATDHTYHGNTMAVAQLSCTNPPPGGHWPNVRHVPAPDSYRGTRTASGELDAQLFTTSVQQAIDSLNADGHGISALIICPYFANEGFPELPQGWLNDAVTAVRNAGGIVIADEVQPGFGRTGTHFWGHEYANIVPEIVTLGKPMANGHPVGGVVTQHAYLEAFRRDFRYFNTFGGNPVSAAAALATLTVVQEEALMENARVVGEYARSGLTQLAQRYDCIDDVRGRGLMFGAELVTSRDTKAPAIELAKQVANGMRQRGVILNFLGIHYNTLKIRPPMPFSQANADHMLNTLDDTLSDLCR